MHTLALTLLLCAQAPEAPPVEKKPVEVDPIEAVDAARLKGELDPAGLRDNWLERARLLAARGDGDGAERAVSVALRIDRDLVLEAGLILLAPILEAARAKLPPEGEALAVGLERMDGGVRAKLLADDLGLVRSAELELSPERVQPLALSVDTPEIESLVEGTAPAEVAVYLLDEHGNVLGGRRVNLDSAESAAAPVSPPKTPEPGPSTLEVTGSSLALAGVLVLAGCAAGTVIVAGGEEPEPLTTVFAAGAIAGALMGAVGIGVSAAAMLAEQGDGA